MTGGRTGCTDQALEFKTGNDIVKPLVSPFSLLLDRNVVVPDCKNTGTDFDFLKGVDTVKVNRTLLRTARINTETTLHTGIEVNGVQERHNLRVVDVDCLTGCHAHLERIRFDDRTDFRTVTTAVTSAADNAACFCFDWVEDTACLLPEGDREVPDVAFYFLYFRVGSEFNVGVTSDIHHLWGQDTL